MSRLAAPAGRTQPSARPAASGLRHKGDLADCLAELVLAQALPWALQAAALAWGLQAAELLAAAKSAHAADLDHCELDEQRLLHASASRPSQQSSMPLPSLGQCQLSTPSRPARWGRTPST